MQIYTKILIGMGVGAAIGILLGPKSVVLEADTYVLPDASAVEWRLDREDERSVVAMPAARLEAGLVELVNEDLVDSAGQTHSMPAWAKVRFRYEREFALRDGSGELRQRLGNPTPGEHVTLWLRIDNVPLASGGYVSSPTLVSGLGETVVTWLRPVGTAFMRLITMVIVPLVFSSLLVGVASLGDVRKLGRLGGKTLGLYMTTTAISVGIGVVLAKLIRPGDFVAEADRAALQAQFSGQAGSRAEQAAEAPSAIDNLLGIIPQNPVAALANGDMLQIIFFAMIFGIALTLLDKKHGTPVVNFFDRVQEAMIVIIHIVMALAPYGVAALVADVIGQSGLSILSALLVYALTVLCGLVIHGAGTYGLLVRLLGRLSWLDFMKAIRPAQLIAFSTSSSSATLPVSMECAEESLGVSRPVASFVLPLGSTVNMDGTALYQGVAAIFIAQVFQIDLSIGAQLGIVATATMASIGAAGVPGAGMVTLAMVLTAAGIPPVGIALILGMDRILDMFRTAVNVTGDLAVTVVMAASEGETPRVLSKKEDAADPTRGFEGRLEHEQQPIVPDEE